MYPQRELTRLAFRKADVRRNIAVQRRQCAAAAAQVMRPLAWLDRARVFLRRLSPWVRLGAGPLGWAVLQGLISRRKLLGRVFRWAPLVVGVLRLGKSWSGRERTAGR
jgi:hypothetical protein